MTEFEVWADRGVALLEPHGPLGADAVPRLRDALREAANLTRRPWVVIVDEKVERVDAIAIAVLLIEHRRLRGRDGALGVVGAQGPIASYLRRMCPGADVLVFASLEETLGHATSVDR